MKRFLPSVLTERSVTLREPGAAPGQQHGAVKTAWMVRLKQLTYKSKVKRAHLDPGATFSTRHDAFKRAAFSCNGAIKAPQCCANVPEFCS